MVDGLDSRESVHNSLLDIFKKYKNKKIKFCRDLKDARFDADRHDFREDHEIFIMETQYDVVILGTFENVEIFVCQRREYSDLCQGYGGL